MASYFLGADSPKSKAGTQLYIVSILAVNRFGRWESKAHFVSSKVFGSVQKMGLTAGAAVDPKFDGDGNLRKVSIDDNYPPLELIPDDEDEDDG